LLRKEVLEELKESDKLDYGFRKAKKRPGSADQAIGPDGKPVPVWQPENPENNYPKR